MVSSCPTVTSASDAQEFSECSPSSETRHEKVTLLTLFFAHAFEGLGTVFAFDEAAGVGIALGVSVR
jgi:hypothetical protein